MKSVTWRYLAGGFVAGVVFVASCGQNVKSTAAAVIQALDISFDNSGTGLSATDVQGAIEELDTRSPSLSGTWLAKDKNGVVIYETPRPDKCGTNHPWFSNIQATDARVGYNPTSTSAFVGRISPP